MKERKIEFYVSPDGQVNVEEPGEPTKQFTEKDNELTEYVISLIKRQYPNAYKMLELEYRDSMRNVRFYHYLIAHRFIRCNFNKFDGLTYDIDGDVLHIEDTSCPLKFRNECPLKGIVCNPKPFDLTEKETKVAKMASHGKSYDEISQEMGIAHRYQQKYPTRTLHLGSASVPRLL